MRILIANRGEIARRIIATARILGHETVAVFAEPDAAAPFVAEATMAVPIGPADPARSYLSVERLLAAAARTGADAVHPGYGFLSENPAFARAVMDAGLIWIGPHPEAVGRLGSKIEARRLAVAAGVPVIPGFDRSQDDHELAVAAAEIGYPVLVKAAAGGGGRGIRVVRRPEDFAAALTEARGEATRSFGDSAMIVERFIERPRHVEVQVMGDRHGHVIHLGTRECSVQRRYQKLLEEAPAPVPPTVETGLCQAATALATSLGYDSAGTVEFIVDDATGEFFFLEMNTRLQVEHPVTELVTGVDLVALMIRAAAGEPLGLTQDDITVTGHAMEARINAEDPAAGFLPQTGTITHLVVPPGVRWDAGVVEGSVVSPHYDAMVAKLIVDAPDRPGAVARLQRALEGLLIGGMVTNTGFQRWLLDQAPVRAGRVTTRFVDENPLPDAAAVADATRRAAMMAARLWQQERRRVAAATWGPWGQAEFSLTPYRPRRRCHLAHHSGAVFDIAVFDIAEFDVAESELAEFEVAEFDEVDGIDDPVPARFVGAIRGDSVAVNLEGTTHTFRVLSRTERWTPPPEAGHGPAGAIVSPFPAVVTEVAVVPGDQVRGGDVMVVVEAMKMLHTLTAGGPGVVAEVRVVPGDQTRSDQVLVTFEQEHSP